jgi:hypothetical protein
VVLAPEAVSDDEGLSVQARLEGRSPPGQVVGAGLAGVIQEDLILAALERRDEQDRDTMRAFVEQRASDPVERLPRPRRR